MRNLLLTLALLPTFAIAGKKEAIGYLNSGQYREAASELQILASEGDTKAMVNIGELHYSGKLGSVDYEQANAWWYRAYKAGNADAFSNIGVLYRDGKGVEQNLEVAYGIFLIVHMRGLGSEGTQIRNNRNLRKTMKRLDQEQSKRALCNSEEYIDRYIDSKGESVEPPKSGEIRIKDKNWWLTGELPNFECGGSEG